MKAVLFSNEIGDSNQIRRIRSFIAAGVELTVFSVRRRVAVNEIDVPLKNRYLFTTGDGRHLSRFFKLFLAIAKLFYHRRDFSNVMLLTGRNIDMLSLVVFCRILFAPRGSIVVYECLDIHRAFTDRTVKASLFRLAERMLLKKVDVILISSPYYLINYFFPVQKYSAETFLLENKLYFGQGDIPPRPGSDEFLPAERIRIGFVGKFKCQVSFELFLKVAETYRDIFEMHVYGYIPSSINGASRIQEHENIKDFGRYRYPDDLRRIYTALDAVWVADLWRPGGNSDWALANRLYEASYFGCPSVSVAGLATADFIVQKKIGYVVENASLETVGRLIRDLHANGTQEMRRQILEHDPRDFVQTEDDIKGLLNVVRRLHAAKVGSKRPRPRVA